MPEDGAVHIFDRHRFGGLLYDAFERLKRARYWIDFVPACFLVEAKFDPVARLQAQSVADIHRDCHLALRRDRC